MFNKLKQSSLFSDTSLYFGEMLAKKAKKYKEETFLISALVSEMLFKGNICLDLNQFDAKDFFCDFYEDFNFEKIDFRKVFSYETTIFGKKNDFLPIIIENSRCYLQKYYFYEDEFAKTMLSFAKKSTEISFDLIKQAEELFDKGSEKIEAVKTALSRDLTIISGGPGTGKTYTVARILYLLFLENKDISVAVLAPTGKAATRLSESISKAVEQINPSKEILDRFLKIEGKTIHRYLGWKFNSAFFKHNKDNPVSDDVVIIDEAGMVSLSLMYKLVSALKRDSKIILLGDKNQLSSVEAGSVFGDLCFLKETNEFFKKCVVELFQSRRFDAKSGIGKLADFVIKTEKLDDTELFIQEFEKFKDLNFKKYSSVKDLKKQLTPLILENFSQYINSYKQDLNEFNSIELFNKSRILTLTSKGNYGVFQINKTVEKILEQHSFLDIKTDWYPFRPVMIKENDYLLNLFNGDIGICFENDDKKNVVFSASNKSTRKFAVSSLNVVETAFATTVHKSQGSEFDNIIFILPETDTKILTKELFYTALTRAKKKIYIFYSSKMVLETAFSRKTLRFSGLKDKLTDKNSGA